MSNSPSEETAVDGKQPRREWSRLRVAAIASVLLFFFSVPLLFLLYGGLAAAIVFSAFLVSSALLQLPLFLLLRHRKLLPDVSLGLPLPDSNLEKNAQTVSQKT